MLLTGCALGAVNDLRIGIVGEGIGKNKRR